MNAKEIKAILQAMVATETDELTLETPDFKLSVRRSVPAPPHAPAPAPLPAAAPAAPVPAAPPPAAEAPAAAPPEPAAETAPEAGECPGCVEITAPIVGTFYRKPAPDAEPFVNVGDRIEKGQVVCIIEAMKLFNEIESEVSGVVRKILVEDGEPVEYGQPLFLVEPA
ncbi:acetyl-CoA carboxylase biotin carboxyl carrier protein [Oceanithermus desulfurans]|uniref:Biotin carboxyl carrier protein of acetyl-CoA carboxylase n=2 Tax=Oceanithermus desulfurans TaxID=227924 RepID=A0ABR6P2M2_9DEIN|nr:acetyl-CoA carboxylase biotin carboxyl carrier protein [Oceanithermus desulfurans]MBB6030255.1 acetyl-CoA carboxylase biotin carboxyl carrier protein [Oceanithermus desulfurans]